MGKGTCFTLYKIRGFAYLFMFIKLIFRQSSIIRIGPLIFSDSKGK